MHKMESIEKLTKTKTMDKEFYLNEFKSSFKEESSSVDTGFIRCDFSYEKSHWWEKMPGSYGRDYYCQEIDNIVIEEINTFDDEGEEVILPDKDLEWLKSAIEEYIEINA